MTKTPLITLGLAALVVVGCGAADRAPRNKAGAEAAVKATVLNIEDPNSPSPLSQHFAERVKERSGGALVVMINQDYPSDPPGNEALAGRLVREGKLDFAVVPARSWHTAGVPGFAALQAPFVLGDFDVAARALAGPAGQALEDDLKHAGVVPLYMAAQVGRRFLTRKPVTAAADFRGLRLRLFDDPTTAADFQALGAQPVQSMAPDETLERLGERRIDGLEIAASSALKYQYYRHALHLTGYAVFFSAQTLVASRGAWERLARSQQDVLLGAGEDVVRFAQTLADSDSEPLKTLCRLGMRVTTPSEAQLRTIAAATEPVRAALRTRPATAKTMQALESTEGAGPRLLPMPDACRTPGAEQDRIAPARKADRRDTLPAGTYETTTTRQDYLRYGPNNWPSDRYTWTTRLADGKWERTTDPAFPGVRGVESAGTYEVSRDKVTFHYTKPQVDALLPETLRFSYFDGRLTLKPVRVTDPGTFVMYSAHPWRKVH